MLWTLGFTALAPLLHAQDVAPLDALFGAGSLVALGFVGMSAALCVKLVGSARAEGNRVLLVLWSAQAALSACAATALLAASFEGAAPPLLVAICQLGLGYGLVVYLFALAIAATRRILVERRDGLLLTGLLALLTVVCLACSAWLVVRGTRELAATSSLSTSEATRASARDEA